MMPARARPPSPAYSGRPPLVASTRRAAATGAAAAATALESTRAAGLTCGWSWASRAGGTAVSGFAALRLDPELAACWPECEGNCLSEREAYGGSGEAVVMTWPSFLTGLPVPLPGHRALTHRRPYRDRLPVSAAEASGKRGPRREPFAQLRVPR